MWGHAGMTLSAVLETCAVWPDVETMVETTSRCAEVSRVRFVGGRERAPP